MFICFLEKQDVHEFLLDNLNNGGILELMMRYLKVISQKFLVKWPPGLCEVVLTIYNSWRKHSSSLPNPLLRDSSNQHIRVMQHFSLFPCLLLSWCARSTQLNSSRHRFGLALSAAPCPSCSSCPKLWCTASPGAVPELNKPGWCYMQL